MKEWSLFVCIRKGWQREGLVGVSLGPAMYIIPFAGSSGQYWTPVLWSGHEDPDWHKSAGLEAFVPKRLEARNLLKRIQQQDNIMPELPVEVMPDGSLRNLTTREARNWRNRAKTRIRHGEA